MRSTVAASRRHSSTLSTQRREWVFAEAGGKSWVADRRWKLYRDGRLFDRDTDPLEQTTVGNVDAPQAKTALTRLKQIHDSLGAE